MPKLKSKKPETHSYCEYCKIFYSSPPMGTKKNMFRKCIKTDQDVVVRSKSCPHFNSHNWFWCEEFNCQLEHFNCLKRRENESGLYDFCGSGRCKQFKEVVYIIELQLKEE